MFLGYARDLRMNTVRPETPGMKRKLIGAAPGTEEI